MSDVNEHLEKLMTRALDGALSEDDELALNRELIRNPEVRRLMAAYRAVDELSVVALNEVTVGEAPVFDTMMWMRAVSWRPRGWQGRTWLWLAPGAIAAALLAMIVPRPSPPNLDRPPVVQALSAPNWSGVEGTSTSGGQQDLMHSVRSTPAIHRNTGREIIGVVGDDGNLYWIEVERTRTVKLPVGSSSRPESLGVL